MARVAEEALPEGSELVEARFSPGPLLTLLVDREDGPVDHGFCSSVVLAVSPALDEAGYDGMIEVSSPGIERPLSKPEHFRRFVGHEAKVRLGEPVDGRRNYSGTIARAGEESFVMRLPESAEESAEVELPFGAVTRAHLKEEI